MALIFTATGTPYAICPNCQRSHVVARRGTYMDKPIRKFRCKNCGTSWRPTESELEELRQHFETKRGAASKNEHSQPDEKQKEKAKPKQKEPPKEKQQEQTKTKPKEKPKRSGWNILGL